MVMSMSESRSALLDAGAREFARYGLKGARVHDIVRRAGVNERMIYYHFGSKAGLYAAVLEAQMQGLRAVCQPVLESSLGMAPYAGMHSVLAAYLDALAARPHLVGLLLHEALGGWSTVLETDGASCVRALRELYRRGQREGVFRPDCPFEVACVTLTGAMLALLVIPPPIPAVEQESCPLAGATAQREQILQQLLCCMGGPASR